MKFKIVRKAALLMFFVAATIITNAATVTGIIVDKATNEPLLGATIIIENTTIGAISNFDGTFSLELKNGSYNLVSSYVSYKSVTTSIVVSSSLKPLTIALEADGLQVDQVSVMGRKQLETQMALQKERATSTVAIENIGAKEMSVKGISNVEEGVKKMTGISVASAGQLVVRGLGDRYSSTTLNGQPIASPNPDNKLIPLDVFPSSTVKNVTVSKVYNAVEYADYSGAHIDIATKDHTSRDFLSAGFSVGADANTIGQKFWSMKNPSLFTKSSMGNLADLSKTDSQNKIKNNSSAFATDFEGVQSTGMPNFSGNLGWGKTFDVGLQKLSILASGSMSNDNSSELNSIEKAIDGSGLVSDYYEYDTYTSALKMALLASANVTLRESDRIGYTFFYARDAADEFNYREGRDWDMNFTENINSVTRIYTMMTHQLQGSHNFSDSWALKWSGAYTQSTSDEPDRRQVMFGNNNGSYSFFTDKQNVVMRYFGFLEEDEMNGQISSDYKFGDHKLTFGAAYRDKSRDFGSTRFYYNVNQLNQNGVEYQFSDLYNNGDYLNYENIKNGTITVTRDMQGKDQYTASHSILSGFASLDLSFAEQWLINLGVRYEKSQQIVNYYAGSAKTRDLSKDDFFPAINVKYNLDEENQIRLAASKTVTRPQFIEMAPFRYQESYGSGSVIGNSELQNGYNYNVDLRYESFFENGDMFSLTGYYKLLQDPIERTQYTQGGGTISSFQNADQGLAAGVELEFRKKIIDDLTLSVNGSYMYTNVKLLESGAASDDNRALQGASPYLVNADLVYSPKINDKQFSVALLYNLQGPRIYAVGVLGCGDVIQRAYHKLNFASSYQISKMVTVRLQLDNLLMQSEIYDQEAPKANSEFVVLQHNPGIGGSVGVSLNF